jgi:hypothetical protein
VPNIETLTNIQRSQPKPTRFRVQKINCTNGLRLKNTTSNRATRCNSSPQRLSLRPQIISLDRASRKYSSKIRQKLLALCKLHSIEQEKLIMTTFERVLNEYSKLPREDGAKRMPLDCSFLLYQLLRNVHVEHEQCSHLLAKENRNKNSKVYRDLFVNGGLKYFSNKTK